VSGGTGDLPWTWPLSPARRMFIYERDGGLCGICQDPEHPVQPFGTGFGGPLSAQVDHIVARSAGGTNDTANLRLAHRFCNGSKWAGPSLPVPYAAARLRWRLYGEPMNARLWLRQHRPGKPLRERSRRQSIRLRRVLWELRTRQVDRGEFRPDRWQVMLRGRLQLARRREARRRAGRPVWDDDDD
jgi:hypothetical protein